MLNSDRFLGLIRKMFPKPEDGTWMQEFIRLINSFVLREEISTEISDQEVDHGVLSGLSDDDHTQYHNDSRANTWFATKSHTGLQDIGTNTHAQIDTHLSIAASHRVDSTIHFTEASIDHTNIQNVGSNTHAQVDTHIADSTVHFTEASIDHGAIAGLSGDDHPQYLLRDFVNGSFKESFNALATSDGATVTLSIEQSGGGDLIMQFSDGLTTLDCTPAATIALTAGSDTSPQDNYIYILQSTKALTKSTSGWPATEHIKIGYFLVPSATLVQSDGVYINQNWNDHLAGTDNQGHMLHMAERSRRLGAIYATGCALTVTDGAAVTLAVASGVIYQMHKHTFAALDMASADKALIVNHSATPYLASTDLTDITADSTGSAFLNNRYFNLVIWGVANKGGEWSPLMVNLPSGQYVTQSGAENDDDNYDLYAIPNEFDTESSTGFLIARLTFQYGASWSHISTKDLRGVPPYALSTGGAGGSTTTTFADNTFNVYDEADATKELEFQVSNVTTSTTRTLTVPDANGTIALTAESDGTVDHTALANKGTNTHATIDTHIADATKHFTEGSIDHTAITNIGTNSHATIDTHIANIAGHNPWKTDYTPGATNRYALIDSVSNSEISTYRIKLFGGHYSDEGVYLQEFSVNCRTGGSGAPVVHWMHIGGTSYLKAGLQIYWNSVTSEYEIYFHATGSGHCAGSVVKAISGSPDTAVPLEIGEFSTTAPTGTLRFDSVDHATYPPTSIADTDATRPAFLGDDLALKSDSDAVASDLTTHEDSGTNSHSQIDTAVSASTSHIASTANPHSVDATDVSPWSASSGASGTSYALLYSFSAGNSSKSVLKIIGATWSGDETYKQEVRVNWGPVGSPVLDASYDHFGETSSLTSGIVIYNNSGTYSVYAKVANGSSNICAVSGYFMDDTDTDAPLIAGSWTTTTPTGSEVFDSTDDTTYPPTLRFDSTATRPEFKGNDLALYSDVTSLDHTDVGAIEDAANSVTNSHLGTGVVDTDELAADAVTNAKMDNMAAWTLKCNATSGSANPTDETGTNASKVLGNGTAGWSGVFSVASWPSGTQIQLTFTNGILTGKA